MTDVSRRTFLLAGTAASGAFLIGAGWTSAFAQDAKPERGERLNAWLEIAPSGIVTVTTGRVEMGQGTYTSLAMLAIEELDFPWANVRAAHAPDSGDHTNLGMFYSPSGMPAPWMRSAARKVLGLQLTGGSMSVRLSYLGIGPGGDCDNDARLDVRQIAENTSLDFNRNGILDFCDCRDNPALDRDRKAGATSPRPRCCLPCPIKVEPRLSTQDPIFEAGLFGCTWVFSEPLERSNGEI